MIRAAHRVPRAALIDLDGTLLDTAPDIVLAANRTLGELGLAPLAAQRITDFIGKSIAVLVAKSLEASLDGKPDEALYRKAQEIFAAHYERVNGQASTPYPGAAEGLAAMRAQGLKLACATNKLERFARPLIEKAGLAGAFDAIVTSDIAGSRKPEPGMFLHACRQFGVAPAEAVVIGDSDNDGEAARAAGCRFLLVPYGYREGKPVHEVRSDGVVATLLAAAALLAAG
jgi:phosphoglycolate phosphatase